jgi:hypothetical protein
MSAYPALPVPIVSLACTLLPGCNVPAMVPFASGFTFVVRPIAVRQQQKNGECFYHGSAARSSGMRTP